MIRSLWKGTFVNIRLYFLKKNVYKKPHFIYDRSSIILRKYLNYYMNIYNGRKFVLKGIKEEYINHKFGEFSLTTKMGSKIHKRPLNKKMKMNKLKKKNK
jgi:ribosomal protein S19